MKLSKLIYRLAFLKNRIKSILFYRLVFGQLPLSSHIEEPMYLINTEGVFVGENVLIRKGARIELLDRPDKKQAKIKIGNNTNIEQNVHIVCQNEIIIGENVSITGGCAIVDTTHPFVGSDHVKQGVEVNFNLDKVTIMNNVFIGFGTTILPNTIIGANSYIAANSVLKGHYPASSVIAGSPGKVIKSVKK